MKYSTMTAIVFCGILAVAMTGCKYDDDELANAGDAQVSDVATEGADEGAIAAGADVGTEAGAGGEAVDVNADSSSLDETLGSKPFDQDANYARCTDVAFEPVYFGFDADALSQGEMPKIEAVAKHLQENPNRVVIVEGNCDERGSNEYNLVLGDQRAIKIRDYLVTIGIDANRIQSKSYGEEKPAVAGQGEAAWSKNRRGEFAVFQHR
ncbi:MAG: OmpA family protein [Kiritimatiellia bacterium]